MKSNTTMTLPTSTTRTTYEITKELNKIADMNMSNGRWMAIPGKEKEVNALLYEMNLAQKQQDLKNEGDITKGEQWGAATVMSILEGLESWDTGTQIAVHKALGQDVPDYLMADSALSVSNARRLEDVGSGLRLISDVSKATGNMLPTMALSMVFPASELASLGKFAKLIYSAATSTSVFTSSFGSNYKQAIREGRPEDEAVSYALLNAASETTLEQLIGIVGGNRLSNWVGEKIAPYVDDIINAVAKNPAVKKKLYDYASAFGGEFVEEFLQSVMQPVFENIAYSGEDYTFENNHVTVTWDNVYDGLVGGIMGSVFESVGMVPKDSTTNTDADIQTKTDTNTKPSAKVKSTSDGKGTSLFDKATQKNLEKLSEADAIAADAEVTNAYAEHLKSEGVSSEAAETFKRESAKVRTSKASAIEHTLKVMSEYGDAIRNRIKKINASNIDTTQTTKPVDANIKLQNKTAFSETELKSMNTPQLQSIVQTLSDDFAKSWKAAGLDPIMVDQQVSEMTRQSDAAELIKSAQIMQKELGFGEAFDAQSDGLQSDFEDDIMKASKLFKQNHKLPPAMNVNQYKKIRIGLSKQGVEVREAIGDELRYLDAMGAEAMIIDSDLILHRGEIPSASAMFEEMIHLQQNRSDGMIDSSDFVTRDIREIEANKKLLKNAEAYGLTKEDISDIERNLELYYQSYKERVGKDYE